MTPTLKASQMISLKAFINADAAFTGKPNTSDVAFDICAAYNGYPNVDFFVWRTDVPAADIAASIDWDKYTPNGAPDNTTTYTNRLLACALKRDNLKVILEMAPVDASRAKTRVGLLDAVSQVPAGNGGTAIDPGGANTMNACTRRATKIEKIFAVGNATAGGVTANLLTAEGELTISEVMTARAS